MSNVVMRAKFQVSQVDTVRDVVSQNITQETVHMRAVARSNGYPADGSDEDNTYAKWSPSGSLTLTFTNPALFGKYSVGDKTYMDFTPAK